LSEESDANWELIQQALAIEEGDPAAAFRLYLQAAEAGSVWSLEALGWRYWTGSGVAAEPDKARDLYRRAKERGSSIAMISYARLLAEDQHHDECEQVLEAGVAANFTPAYFWLAWFRYDRCRTRTVAREIRPLLEHAAREGHPAAEYTLARLMVIGQFGLLAIPRGLTMCVRGALDYARHQPEIGTPLPGERQPSGV
jgi:TPR repeat protein